MQKVTLCLWFNNNAEAAVNFYCSVFKNSGIDAVVRYSERQSKLSQQPAGSVMTIAFHLDGQDYLALNGGPHFKPTPAMSLMVNCDSQSEIDTVWSKLLEGGAAMQCGWLTDKFGVSWQVVPRSLGAMMKQGTEAQQEQLMMAIMTMVKLDLAVLQQAYEQAGAAL
jgi:predicted 3-demethylubiquinone-9 3-methyltransferase (glyoxalase superfamily)